MEYKELHLREEVKDPAVIDRARLVDTTNLLKSAVRVRANGIFQDRAFWLDKEYDWVIGMDNIGNLVLVPLLK